MNKTLMLPPPLPLPLQVVDMRFGNPNIYKIYQKSSSKQISHLYVKTAHKKKNYNLVLTTITTINL